MSLFFLGFSSDCSMQYIAGVTKLSKKNTFPPIQWDVSRCVPTTSCSLLQNLPESAFVTKSKDWPLNHNASEWKNFVFISYFHENLTPPGEIRQTYPRRLLVLYRTRQGDRNVTSKLSTSRFGYRCAIKRTPDQRGPC